MRKFDLEKALMGHPVVTRSGHPVEIIAHKVIGADCTLVGWMGDVPVSWYKDGKHMENSVSSLDLFLDGEQEYYIAIFKDDDGMWASEHIYYTQEEAAAICEDLPYFYNIVKILT